MTRLTVKASWDFHGNFSDLFELLNNSNLWTELQVFLVLDFNTANQEKR